MKKWTLAGGSIRQKLMIGFSLLIVLIATFVFVFFPNRLGQQASRAQFARAQSVRNMLEYSVRAAVFFGDTTAVLEVLASAARDPDILVIEVRDAAGRVVARQSAAGWKGAADSLVPREGVTRDGSAYISTGPIVVDGTPVGTLALGLSLASVRADVAGARRLGLLVGALILIGGLAVVGAISTLVTRPLKSVVETAQRITAGDLTPRAPDTEDVDVAQLVRAFNLMVGNLAGTQAELSRFNAHLEERVQARTAELQSLIEMAPQAIVSVDLEWRVKEWNRAAERLFCWSAEEVCGKPVPFVPPDQTEDFRMHQQALLESRTTYSREAVRMRKDGRRVSVLISSGATFDAAGRVTGYLAFLADLTEQKTLEDQLRQSQKMEAIGRLAGGIAHDFNNILTIITASAALMFDTELTEQQRNDLEQIKLAALRATALTRQLLTFSRQHVVQLEPVDLNEIVHGLSPMLRRLLRENIRVVTTLSLQDGIITADPRQIEQLLMNLVVNAADAMPDGGKLTIETLGVRLDEKFTQRHPGVAPGDYVMLAVRDTGVGIDAASLPRIFEPFFTTKDVGKGTGLGLATAYAVVKQLKGCIEVQSALDMGTAMLVYIPRTQQPKDVLPRVAGGAAPPVAGRETILLVEDEDGVRRMLRRTLEHLGYMVLEASHGERGLEVFEENAGQIDLVVTDIMMPGMNGREFAQRLHAVHPELRVVFISGYADEASRDQGLVDDNHAFLPKPFTGLELGEMIRSLLDRPRRSARV